MIASRNDDYDQKTACGFRGLFSFKLPKRLGCFEKRLGERMKVLGSLAKRLGLGFKVLGFAPKDLACRINILVKRPKVLVK